MTLTVRDVARLLDVSEKTIYRWVSQGTMPVYRVNEQYRFNRAEILEWATSRRIAVSPEIFAEPESRGGRPPRLDEALAAGGIYYRVGGTDKASVLGNVVELMRLPEGVDREFLVRVLLAREELASTALGDGVAIPHVRGPVVLHVAEPTMSLCFLDKALDFGALDGKPVHALFTLVCPTVRAHLHLLARLGFALRDPAFLQAVQDEALRETILQEARRVEAGLDHPTSSTPAARGRAARSR